MATQQTAVSVNLSGVYQVPVTKSKDQHVNVRVHDMTQETMANVFAHGLKQLVNDATSGMKEPGAIMKAAKEMAERLSQNAWSPGKGGGHKLSPFEVEIRNVAEQQLRLVCGRSGADVKVTDVEKACRDVVVTLLTRKNGGDHTKVKPSDVDAVLPKQIEAWTKAARTNLETAAALSVI